MNCPNTNPWTFIVIPDKRIIRYDTSFPLYTEEHRNKYHGCLIRRSKRSPKPSGCQISACQYVPLESPRTSNSLNALGLLKFFTWPSILTARPDGKKKLSIYGNTYTYVTLLSIDSVFPNCIPSYYFISIYMYFSFLFLVFPYILLPISSSHSSF